MDRAMGLEDVAAVLVVLALLAGASLRFAQVATGRGEALDVGRGTRTFFFLAAWVSSLGAIVGWLGVLVERVLGPLAPIDPWLVAVVGSLVAPPLGQMNARLSGVMDADPGEPGPSANEAAPTSKGPTGPAA